MKHIDLTKEPKIVARMMMDTVEQGDGVRITYSCPNPACPSHSAEGIVAHKDNGGIFVLGINIDNQGYDERLGIQVAPDGEIYALTNVNKGASEKDTPVIIVYPVEDDWLGQDALRLIMEQAEDAMDRGRSGKGVKA